MKPAKKSLEYHGMTGTPEYNGWKWMRKRCLYPGSKDYKDYGGRGITICEMVETGMPEASIADGITLLVERR